MTEPAGSMNLAVKYFRNMLGDTPAILTWMSEPAAVNALERIHYEGLPDPVNGVAYEKKELEMLRPFAFVYIADQAGFSRRRISTSNFDQVGSIVLHLEQNSPESLGDGPTSDANTQWSNTIGLIIDGLIDLRVAGAAGHLMFDRIRLMLRGSASKEQAATQGMFQRALLSIDFDQ